MSLVNLAAVCAHLQNTTRALLLRTLIPYTRLHIDLAENLYKQGFISGVRRGDLAGPDREAVEVTPDNIATRRLWLDLKYRNGSLVIRSMQLVLKPSRRVRLLGDQLQQLAMGRRVRTVAPIQPGEAVFVKDRAKKIWELRDAAKRGLDAEVLVRLGQ